MPGQLRWEVIKDQEPLGPLGLEHVQIANGRCKGTEIAHDAVETHHKVAEPPYYQSRILEHIHTMCV